jgi:hypothetical protein
MNEIIVKTRQTLKTIEASFRHLRGLSEQQFLMGHESDFFWRVISELVDVDHDEILYWAFLEPLEEAWLLVLIGDELRLARFGQQEAEFRFLGRLHGDYVERVQDKAGNMMITLSFRDRRLPRGIIELEAQAQGYSLEALQPLRDRFRQWSKTDNYQA